MKNCHSDSGLAPGTVPPPRQSLQFLDLRQQFAAIREEVMDAVNRVFESQHFIMGPEVSAFEEEIAPLTGCRFTIGCASGSDALLLALMAFEVGPGDEVVTTPFTFVATAGSIARLGARPVFVDIDPETFNLDPAQLEKAITPKTKAIIPVHLFGLAAEMEPIVEIARRYRVAIVEDAAQAVGARYREEPVGTFGAIACFSFFPSKNLGGVGDGGLISTNDPVLADRLKVLRVHGARQKYRYEELGINSRLDALQAAVLRVKLHFLDAWTAGRQRNAHRYRQLFSAYGGSLPVRLPLQPKDRFHVYNQFTIRTPRRDALKEHLQQNGIPTEIYYPIPLHLQPAFANLGYRPGNLPESERASSSVLSLPICPEVTADQQETIVSSVADFFDSKPL
jgi:dTDP-4-amino-4,6-dideoxygalactose transaminase